MDPPLTIPQIFRRAAIACDELIRKHKEQQAEASGTAAGTSALAAAEPGSGVPQGVAEAGLKPGSSSRTTAAAVAAVAATAAAVAMPAADAGGSAAAGLWLPQQQLIASAAAGVVAGAAGLQLSVEQLQAPAVTAGAGSSSSSGGDAGTAVVHTTAPADEGLRRSARLAGVHAGLGAGPVLGAKHASSKADVAADAASGGFGAIKLTKQLQHLDFPCTMILDALADGAAERLSQLGKKAVASQVQTLTVLPLLADGTAALQLAAATGQLTCPRVAVTGSRPLTSI